MKTPKQGAMQVLEASSVMDQMTIDLTGPHLTSTTGFAYMLTAVDLFSRFIVAVPLKNKTAETVADALYRHIFCVFGTVRVLKSDLCRV